jgi:dCMP deaminase
MKKKFIDYFMSVADLTAKLSYAKRLQVGAVIVKGNKVLATGYNGMPTGWENVCETETVVDGGEGPSSYETQLVTKPEVLHAETNAIAKVAQSTESSEGSTMFCTHAPCLDCAKLIYQSGINTLYFSEYYRSEAGLKFLEQGGVHVHHYEV